MAELRERAEAARLAYRAAQTATASSPATPARPDATAPEATVGGGIEWVDRSCRACQNQFQIPVIIMPSGQPFGGGAGPERCPRCVALAETAEAEERERAARAYRASPDNPEYIARLAAAGFEDERLHRATLRSFNPADNPRAHAAAINFVKAVLNPPRDGDVRRWLFLNGFTGVGKSHLLVGIDRALYVAGYPGRVVIDVIPTLVRRIQSGYSNGRSDGLVESRLAADVWLGDDLGRGKQRDDAVWLISEIGCGRVGRWTAWSSNYDRAGLVNRNEEYEVLASRLGPAYCWGEVLVGRDRRDDVPAPHLAAA